MNLFAWLVFLAAGRVELVDQVFEIPAAEWRYVDQIVVRQMPVTVDCNFELVGRGQGVRIALLSHGDLNRLRQERPHGFIAATPRMPRGSMRYQVRVPGEYAIVVDNREGEASPVRVHLRLALDFSGQAEPQVRYLSRPRQLAVILISFAVFFGIVIWSARRLLRAIKR